MKLQKAAAAKNNFTKLQKYQSSFKQWDFLLMLARSGREGRLE